MHSILNIFCKVYLKIQYFILFIWSTLNILSCVILWLHNQKHILHAKPYKQKYIHMFFPLDKALILRFWDVMFKKHSYVFWSVECLSLCSLRKQMVKMSIPSSKQYDRIIYDIMMLKSKQYLSLNCFVSALAITWLCGDLSSRRVSSEGIYEALCVFMFWCLVCFFFLVCWFVCLFLVFCCFVLVCFCFVLFGFGFVFFTISHRAS